MKNLIHAGLFAVSLTVAIASAEVVDSANAGFTTVHEELFDADRAVVWQIAVGEVGTWWNSDHTISGDSERLSITAVPQGCFCESFGEGAGLVHLTVTMVSPGAVIRLTGGLGPLGVLGVQGNMTWEFESMEAGTRVIFTYAVGGYRPGGLEELAGPVDYVIGDALARLKAQIEGGESTGDDVG